MTRDFVPIECEDLASVAGDGALISGGQTAVQDVEANGSGTTVTDYGLGARGVDAVFRTDSAGTAVGYPVYDGHGNRVASLTKSGASFALSDVRSYDAWGGVLSGATTGRPRARYVASIGHVQDDESGLVYMRARYYEPSSGRFVSEDRAMHGRNWQTYCSNDPVNRTDSSGTIDDREAAKLTLQFLLLWMHYFGGGGPYDPTQGGPDSVYERTLPDEIRDWADEKEREQREKRLGQDFTIDSETDVLIAGVLLWAAATVMVVKAGSSGLAGVAVAAREVGE